MKNRLLLCFLLAGFAGCTQHIGDRLPPNPTSYDENRFISYIHTGMPKDSVESVAGEPVLIVDGIPGLQSEMNQRTYHITVTRKEYDRYETWFFDPSRIDTIRSSVPVVLFSSEYDDYPQNRRVARLEYSFAVVFNKSTQKVVREGYFPRGFVDEDRDIDLGAIVVSNRGPERLPHS